MAGVADRAVSELQGAGQVRGCSMSLVHRTAESRVLERFLVNAAASEGGLVVLSGEAGIGKTSLLHELGVRATALGFTVSHLHVPPQHLAEQEALWLRIWRSLCRTLKADRSTAVFAGAAQGADGDGQTFLNGHVFDHGTATPPDPQFLASLSEEILPLLDSLSQHRPFLLAIDDVQYADYQSLQLLESLSHWLSSLSVLVALAYSPSGLNAPPRVDRIIEMLAGRGRVIDVGPLDEEAVTQVLSGMLGIVPDRHLVHSELSATLHEIHSS